MKTRILFTTLAASLVTWGSFAQTIENDDMYFSKKDRAKLNAQQTPEIMASAKSVNKKASQTEPEENINPTDSYSARNVNPEFAARSNAQTAQADNEDYFVSNYQQYSTTSDLNNWNNNFSSWYGNSWYNSNYYGSSINSWNSPYYGFNDPYMSPWYNPYWSNSGWSTSFSYYWGNSSNYGWGGNYNSWNQPYCGGSSWGPSVGLGMGWSSGWYGPGTTVVVVNNYGEGRYTSYGKRGTRATNMVSERPRIDRTRPTQTVSTQTSSNLHPTLVSNGRGASSASNHRQEYYNKSWRSTTSSPSTLDNSSQNNNSRSSGWNWDNNNTGRSGNNSSFSGSSPSRNSSSSFSGGTRSSGSSGSSGSSSGSSGGRGRTRN